MKIMNDDTITEKKICVFCNLDEEFLEDACAECFWNEHWGFKILRLITPEQRLKDIIDMFEEGLMKTKSEKVNEISDKLKHIIENMKNWFKVSKSSYYDFRVNWENAIYFIKELEK
jgi:hypothetical protein